VGTFIYSIFIFVAFVLSVCIQINYPLAMGMLLLQQAITTNPNKQKVKDNLTFKNKNKKPKNNTYG
jgi:hypothetical protein